MFSEGRDIPQAGVFGHIAEKDPKGSPYGADFHMNGGRKGL